MSAVTAEKEELADKPSEARLEAAEAEDRETALPSKQRGVSHVSSTGRMARGISGSSARQAPFQEEELRQLSATLSTRLSRRSRAISGVSEDGDDGVDVDGLLGRIFQGDDEERHQGGVSFSGLTVKGKGVGATENVSFGTVLSFLAWPPNLVRQIKAKKRTPVRNIIDDFSGVLEPGEMCLVVGRPGSGCTTFLKAVSGFHKSYEGVEGDLRYGPIGVEEMVKHYRSRVTFNAEHLATISVQETLKFAIKCRTPPKDTFAEGETVGDFRHTFLEVLGAVFGLTRVFGTKVGNELIRGVSGGEKKRVSIAETLTSRSKVQCWDSATRGLDSSTALEYVKALRAVTNMSGASIFVSLYQVSDELTRLFDKVLVIEKGRQVYFGPTEKAQGHFESLGFERPPRQPLADYLSGVGDVHARTVRKGYEEKLPRTPEQLQEAYRKSQFFTDNQHDLEEFRKQLPEHDAASSKKVSSYSLSFPQQVYALALREYLVKLGDPLSLGARYVASIFQALIIGSLFYNISPDTNGAFLRGGVMFFSLLFMSLLSMSELSAAFDARPILAKQSAFAFYRPAAWSLATILADAPVLAVQVILFSVVIYFMAQLAQTASQFFIFVLFLYFTSLTITAFFRALAAITPSLNAATPLSGIGIQALVVYTGYLIPYYEMPYWLRFLKWINPLSYGFESLQANEFYNREMYCVENTFVPYGAGYTDAANRVCTLAGSQPGQRYVSGAAYILDQFEYTRSHLWRNFGAICGFWVCFVLIATIGFEWRSSAGGGGGDVLIFKRGLAPAEVTEALEKGKAIDDVEASANTDGKNGQVMTDEEAKEKQRQADKEAEAHLVKQTSIFTWQHLNYFVGSGDTRKQLLSDISGYAKPGVLTALVGESGAGKTTLLTVLSERTDSGVVEGDIFVDGEKLRPSFARKIGFCEQQDIHAPNTTVREALIFSATLRQTGPQEEKEKYVDEIIKLLELEPIQHALVGTPGQGLNIEQRKRLTIGVELAAKPQLLIFLDEPTSGLDAQAAQEVVRFLRKLASAGQAIICTIHQPSALLFNEFDNLVLLGRGGRTFYVGETGDDSSKMVEYFEGKGAKKLPKGYNPAEWVLEVVGAGASATSKQDWHQIWNESPEKKSLLNDIDGMIKERHGKSQEADAADDAAFYANGYAAQQRALIWRDFQQIYRDTPYLMGKLMLHIFGALFNGFTFLRIGTSTVDLQNRLFSTFLAVVIAPPLIQQLQPRFIAARSLREAREGKARIYGWLPQTISSILVEIPFAVVFGSIYFQFGMAQRIFGGRWAMGWLAFVTFELFVCSFGQMIASLAPNALFASLLVPFFFSFVVAFAGVLAPPASIPTFWRSWIIYLTPFRWLIGFFLVIELHDLPVNCTNSEFFTLIPPAGETCGAYMANFFAAGGAGYITDNAATGSCDLCQYASGDQYLPRLEIDYGQRWQYYAYFLAYQPFNWAMVIILTYLFRVKGYNPLSPIFALKNRLSGSRKQTTTASSTSSPKEKASVGSESTTLVPTPSPTADNPYEKQEKQRDMPTTGGVAGEVTSKTGKTA